LSVGDVVVDAGAVVVVAARVLEVVEPEPEVVVVVEAELPELPELPAALLVVVVVGGATKAFVSPRSVATVVEGFAARLVQLRALFQLLTAAVAGCPVSGWGRPDTIVAGRQTALVTCRPSAVMMREPLSVSGAALS
jgi:hypothetical protein